MFEVGPSGMLPVLPILGSGVALGLHSSPQHLPGERLRAPPHWGVSPRLPILHGIGDVNGGSSAPDCSAVPSGPSRVLSPHATMPPHQL